MTIDHHDVRILVELQERRQRRNAILDRAIEQDLGPGCQLGTDEHVDVTEANRKGKASKSR